MYAENQPATGKNILHIINVDNRHEFTCNIKGQSTFTNDSKKAVYITQSDSLSFLDLASFKTIGIPHVQDFSVAKEGDWLASNSQGNLSVTNIVSGKTLDVKDVTYCRFNDQGNTIIAYQKVGQDKSSSFIWIDLETGRVTSFSTIPVHNWHFMGICVIKMIL